MAEEINFVEEDVKEQFMHPHRPFTQLHFLTTADNCWVPVNSILFSVKAPITVNGILFSLSENT